MEPFEILHLATYESFGGAARAASRIYNALKLQPVQCEMFTMLKTSNDASIHLKQFEDPHANLTYIQKLLHSYNAQKDSQNQILESYGEVSAGILDDIHHHQAAIVHLHWICNFLSIDDISKIEKPVIWTLHDMWPFSGSEHFTYDADAYIYKHASDVPSEDSKSYLAFMQKQESWRGQHFHLVAPSNWMAERASRSILFSNHPISVIPLPVDEHFWAHQNRHRARRKFNFNPNKKQILFIGQNLIQDLNKGWDLLQQSLAQLSRHSELEFELVVAGHQGELILDSLDNIHSVGPIQDDKHLVNLYSAVDLLVMPSRLEAFSQVTLEAQSCGLPVVGFDIGGIPDILIHQKTGWIANPYDVDDFSRGIEWILSEEGRSKILGLEGRKNVIKKFSSEKVSEQYLALYEEVLSRNS